MISWNHNIKSKLCILISATADFNLIKYRQIAKQFRKLFKRIINTIYINVNNFYSYFVTHIHTYKFIVTTRLIRLKLKDKNKLSANTKHCPSHLTCKIVQTAASSNIERKIYTTDGCTHTHTHAHILTEMV